MKWISRENERKKGTSERERWWKMSADESGLHADRKYSDQSKQSPAIIGYDMARLNQRIAYNVGMVYIYINVIAACLARMGRRI